MTTMLCLVIALVSAAALQGQPRYWYRYDIASATLDSSLAASGGGPFEATPWSAGRMPGRADLPAVMPDDSLLLGDASRLRRAADVVDVASWPARCAVALRVVRNDSTFAHCSGTLVGPTWVLSAAHCMRDYLGAPYAFRTQRLRAYPAWDDSAAATSVTFADVVRVHHVAIPGTNPLEADMVLLELDRRIGDDLGWVGLAPLLDSTTLAGRLVHTLSYPAGRDALDNRRRYDGDTLWHRVGRTTMYDAAVGIAGTWGVPGESGSTFLLPDAGGYVAVGSLTTSFSLIHVQADAWMFPVYADLIRSTTSVPATGAEGAGVVLAPNPARERLAVVGSPGADVRVERVVDARGVDVTDLVAVTDRSVDLSGLSPGAYRAHVRVGGIRSAVSFVRLP